ncbi:hypothetical protein TREMEDRAFT_59670 [Tremella mesenterica DSM 1558]|uniref:uncharacterized protein n=1 Tax=Tremella mesenterica (strain ATCC 24925 / CBS 8224 / DSM 1558 / NBRC 9311 / NRRL Y-6157 / RJB 2259-6 / UBC 559-6) TaxID=578456 RepID=UPI0003F490FF|nr:uncharacterized protein TREMEDRAFT_59670 [Tremella mesenterica DSM 1558]EIW73496.1 hypothetical protein TREMEDRAFT_59670 [Tremella mesenterica DSM 1558]
MSLHRMFGLNYPGQATDTQQNWNNNKPVVPLRQSDDLTVDEWFAHGMKDYPPAPGNFMELPSGGTFDGCDLACNRFYSRLRRPDVTVPQEEYACPDLAVLHVPRGAEFTPTPNISWLGGSALAISYTSDVDSLGPDNMTVISVNATSPWWRLTTYEIPVLPPCPPGGCLCTWNWFHTNQDHEGYGAEMYNVLYRCNVTGNTDPNVVVHSGQVPTLCEDGPCVSGPKKPMYQFQKTGNNLPKPTHSQQAPTYNSRYGFNDGAQPV